MGRSCAQRNKSQTLSRSAPRCLDGIACLLDIKQCSDMRRQSRRTRRRSCQAASLRGSRSGSGHWSGSQGSTTASTWRTTSTAAACIGSSSTRSCRSMGSPT